MLEFSAAHCYFWWQVGAGAGAGAGAACAGAAAAAAALKVDNGGGTQWPGTLLQNLMMTILPILDTRGTNRPAENAGQGEDGGALRANAAQCMAPLLARSTLVLSVSLVSASHG